MLSFHSSCLTDHQLIAGYRALPPFWGARWRTVQKKRRGEGKTMKLNKKLIAIPVSALAAGIGLTACSSGGTTPNASVANPTQSTPSAPASAPASTPAGLVPGTATTYQICHDIIGSSNGYRSVESVVTPAQGQDGYTDMTAPVDSGNALANCTAVMSDGTTLMLNVTLFPNGSFGWHKGTL
jgi:hypothetical protein